MNLGNFRLSAHFTQNAVFNFIRIRRERRRRERLLAEHLRRTIDWIGYSRASVSDRRHDEALRQIERQAIEIRAHYLRFEHKTPALRATIDDLAALADEVREALAQDNVRNTGGGTTR